MIFLTVGTDLVFNRMIKAVDEWAMQNPDIEIIAQLGAVTATDYHPKNMREKSMLSPREYNQYCNDADFLIAHAGMGSIITALSIRKPIVLMPRLAKYKEHRNDHQLATASRFISREGVFIAMEEHEIPERIEAAKQFSSKSQMEAFDPFAPSEFTNKISDFISNA